MYAAYKSNFEHFKKTPKMNHHCDWQANAKPTGWLVTAWRSRLLEPIGVVLKRKGREEAERTEGEGDDLRK